MKTTIFLLISVLLLGFSGRVCSNSVVSNDNASEQKLVNVMCTPDLYELTTKWAIEYGNLNPEFKINVIGGNIGDNNKLGTSGNLSFITNKSQSATTFDWKMVVARNVIVPIMNADNPLWKELMQRGISKEMFAEIFTNPEKQIWGTLLGSDQKSPIHIYLVNDEVTKTSVAKFIQVTRIPVTGITFGTKDEVISIIQKDPYAIGFCNVQHIIGSNNQTMVQNIRLMPIDKNGNGTLEYMENIYSDLTLFMRGVWIGKYPKALFSNIYAVSKVQPTDKADLAFLFWVLTDGQQLLNSGGFTELASNESQSQLDMINAVPANASVADTNAYSLPIVLLLILGAAIAIGVVVNSVVRQKRNNKLSKNGVFSTNTPGFDEHSVAAPNGLYFDKSHTWAFMEKDGTVTVGIDDFLQHVTGPVTRVEMKNPGEKIKKGDLLFSIIQFGKQLKIAAPISGTIKRQNESLVSKSSFINSSPYNDGWVYSIEPSNWYKEIQFMDIAEKYKRWLNAEFLKLKDFIAATIKPEGLEYANVVLQDGGVLKDGLLSEFGPEVWEDFQTNFLGSAK